MTLGTDLSDAMRTAIQESDLNVHQLAKQSGVSHPVILRFVSGKRDIRLATASKLAKALSVTLVLKEGAKTITKIP